jgi:methionyl-tRNA formyltransferase
MKVVFLSGPAANHRALANKLNAVMGLTAIVLVGPPQLLVKQATLTRFVAATLGLPLRRAWRSMMTYYDGRWPSLPWTEVSSHHDVNSAGVARLMERIQPDLVMVSGTNLLKRPLIDTISNTGRVMNLHTGISPYVRGAPNCTNWCLALGEFDLIGNTVMWLDAGIDTGKLIATERTPLKGTETLAHLHLAVMEHGHDLYCRCLVRLRDGLSLPSITQDQVGQGRLFLSKQWTGREITKAVINYYLRFRGDRLGHKRTLRLISLGESLNRPSASRRH